MVAWERTWFVYDAAGIGFGMIIKRKKALLALANGDVFHGYAIGAAGTACAEIVFNTSMTGYQEILTDPSYAGQMVTLTGSHVGNVGVNSEDVESRGLFLKGLIIRDLPSQVSNWRTQQSLPEYLVEHNVVGIGGIDTRQLVRVLRTEGAQGACIMAAAGDESLDPAAAVAEAKQSPSLSGQDLASQVTIADRYVWDQGIWQLGSGYKLDESEAHHSEEHHVVAVDFGVKYNLLRSLQSLGCKVTVVPATTSFKAIQELSPNGVFLSNGPGDPEPCSYAIELAKQLVLAKIPTLGICLGHQILALACGAQTFKMKFGHHGANHPVQDLQTKEVMITSQNHGFAVSEEALPQGMEVTHRSLFDNTIQGIRLSNAPAFGFQGHPEASPGPHDARPVFVPFIDAMRSKNHINEK